MNFRLPWYFSLAFIVCWPAAVLGETYSSRAQNGDSITLHDAPCVLKSGWFKTWKKAVFKYRGKDYEACWVRQNQHIVVLDSEGVISPVPMQAFRKDEVI